MRSEVVVPKRGRSHQGVKPWLSRATVAIPHIGDPQPLFRCVELLRLQTVPLHIMVIDTGTPPGPYLDAVLALNGSPDVEVHSLRSHGWRHPSEPVSVAMDLAVALCRTEWLVCTHADCFMTRRDSVADLLATAETGPGLTGYAITAREHWRNTDGTANEDWKWMVGHTFTALNVEYARSLGIRWDLTALGEYLDFGRDPDTWPNIVDTEVALNYFFWWETGQKPQQIGTEENYKRNITLHFDHVRSAISGAIYLPEKSDLRQKQIRWMRSALREADHRIAQWKQEIQQSALA